MLKAGGLIATGTVAKPIRFTADAAEPKAGAWQSLWLYDYTLASSRLEYVTIEYAVWGLWLRAAPAGVTYRHATIRHSSSHGVQILSGTPAFDHFTISDVGAEAHAVSTGGTALTLRNSTLHGSLFAPNATALTLIHTTLHGGLHAPLAANPVLESNSFRNSAASVVHPNTVPAVAGSTPEATAQTVLRVAGGTLAKSGTWPARTYRIQGNVHVSGTASPVLTVEAGSTLRFAGGTYLRVGFPSGLRVGLPHEGGLVAKGTAAKPIRFTADAAEPKAGAWRGLLLYDGTLASSRLEYVTIEYPVVGLWFRGVPAGVTFRHTTIRHSSSHGVQILSGTPAFDHFTISDVGAEAHAVSTGVTALTLRNSTLRSSFYAPHAANAVLENNAFHDTAGSQVHPNLVEAVAGSTPDATAQTVLGVAEGTLSNSATWPARTYRDFGHAERGEQ